MDSAHTWSDIARDQALPSVYVILEHQRNVTRWQETNYLNYVLNRKTRCRCVILINSYKFEACYVNPAWCFVTSVLHENDQTVLPSLFAYFIR